MTKIPRQQARGATGRPRALTGGGRSGQCAGTDSWPLPSIRSPLPIVCGGALPVGDGIGHALGARRPGPVLECQPMRLLRCRVTRAVFGYRVSAPATINAATDSAVTGQSCSGFPTGGSQPLHHRWWHQVARLPGASPPWILGGISFPGNRSWRDRAVAAPSLDGQNWSESTVGPGLDRRRVDR
jgi:hypothetical protein